MNLKRHFHKAVIVVALLEVGSCMGQRSVPPSRVQIGGANLCSKLSEIKHIPFEGEPINDAIYNQIAANHQEAIPCLIEQITNETKMHDPRSEPVESNFRVGDLAFFLLLDFTKVPFEEMLPRDVNARLNTEGVYAYFQYVSTSGNRVALQKRWQKWLKQHKPAKVSKPGTLSHESDRVDPPKPQ